MPAEVPEKKCRCCGAVPVTPDCYALAYARECVSEEKRVESLAGRKKKWRAAPDDDEHYIYAIAL